DNLELRYEHVPSSKLGNMPMPALRPSFSSPSAPAVIDYGGNTQMSGGQIVAKAAAAAAAPKKEPPRKIADVQLPSGAPIPLEELEGFPIFKGMATAQLAKLPGSVVLRKFSKGEFICREGDYGYTAFYLVAGSCEVYIGAPMAHVTSVKQEHARGGFFGLLR